MDQTPLTPGDVRDVVFDKAPLGKRGYDEKQVDAFLDLVEATLTGNARLTADEVRNVVFEDAALIKRGYHEDQVDDFLDLVVSTFELHERARITPPTPPPLRRMPLPAERTEPMVFAKPPSLHEHHDRPERPDPQERHDELDEFDDEHTQAHVRPPNDLLALPLPPAPPGTRGYRPGDVERLAKLLARAVEEVNGPTSADIRTASLHRTFFNGQGYRTDVIDTIVNAWVEELRRRES